MSIYFSLRVVINKEWKILIHFLIIKIKKKKNSCDNAAWIEEEDEMDTEASEGETDSETSSESQTSTCSDQSNSNLSNNSYINEDGEFVFLSTLKKKNNRFFYS